MVPVSIGAVIVDVVLFTWAATVLALVIAVCGPALYREARTWFRSV